MEASGNRDDPLALAHPAPAHREGTPSIQRLARPIEGIVMGFPGYLLIGLVFLGLVAAMLQTIAEETKRARMNPAQRPAHDEREARMKLPGQNS